MMDLEILKSKILSLSANIVFEDGKQFPSFVLPANEWHNIAKSLKEDRELSFNYLFSLTGVQLPSGFGVIYHIESVSQRTTIRIKVMAEDASLPCIDSVCDIWQTAELNEREAYEFFGIQFNNHPDLRRLFLEEDFEGFPFRKDFQDEVNIVSLIK